VGRCTDEGRRVAEQQEVVSGDHGFALDLFLLLWLGQVFLVGVSLLHLVIIRAMLADNMQSNGKDGLNHCFGESLTLGGGGGITAS
jgi:hypothetical protein